MLADAATWLVDRVVARARAVLVVALILTALAGWLASTLQLEPNLRRLLPADDPVVAELDLLDRSFGTISLVTVVLEGSTPEGRRAFADAAAEAVEDSPLVSDVRHRTEPRYFADRALYYLEDPEFEELRERVEAWRHHAMCSRAPDVCTLKPDPQAPERLRDTLERQRETFESRARFTDYFDDDELGTLAFFVRPISSPHDFEASEAVEQFLRGTLNALAASEGAWSGGDLEVGLLGGHVVNPQEKRILSRDMAIAGGLGFAAIAILLSVVFRTPGVLVPLAVPLACGLLWALGLAALAVGRLNVLTAMISSVIVGMGIDAGIHLLARVREARRTRELDAAIRTAFAELAGPLLVAATTTVAGFATIATSSYPLFFEFGLIAGLGVATCLLAMFTVFPALLALLDVRAPTTEAASAPSRAPHVVGRAGLVLLAVVTVVGLTRTSPRFERDGRAMQSDSLRAERLHDVELTMELFGTVQFPALRRVVAYSDYDAYARRLVDDHAARTETTVAEFLALPSFLPPASIDLAAREEAVLEMSEDLDDETWDRLAGIEPVDDEFGEFEEFPDEAGTGEGEAGAGGEPEAAGEPVADANAEETMTPEQVEGVKRMFTASPPTPEGLPDSVRDRFVVGEEGFVVIAYPNFDATDVFDSIDFQRELESYASPGERPYVGEPIVLAAMYEKLRVETPPIVAMASALALLFVLVQTRSLRWTLVTLAPVGVGIAAMIALMPWFGVKLTLINVPVIPAIVGIGVDNGVYVVAALRGVKDPDERRARARHAARTVFVSAATTVAGFAALLIADSGGVQSIGSLAALGLSCSAAVALLTLASAE